MKEIQQRKRGDVAGLLFWKRNVLRLDLKESRVGFCQRGRGTSFCVEGPETERHENLWWDFIRISAQVCSAPLFWQRPHKATAEEMTKFHSDEYIKFLRSIRPDNMSEYNKQMQRCKYTVYYTIHTQYIYIWFSTVEVGLFEEYYTLN